MGALAFAQAPKLRRGGVSVAVRPRLPSGRRLSSRRSLPLWGTRSVRSGAASLSSCSTADCVRPSVAPRESSPAPKSTEMEIGCQIGWWETAQLKDVSQDRICGHTLARAWRPIKIARCCRHAPTSPGYSMIRPFFAGIASMNGLIAAGGATSSEVLTIAKVGVERLNGPKRFSPMFSVPRQKRFSR